jgi:hypothetical protein
MGGINKIIQEKDHPAKIEKRTGEFLIVKQAESEYDKE